MIIGGMLVAALILGGVLLVGGTAPAAAPEPVRRTFPSREWPAQTYQFGIFSVAPDPRVVAP
jgi:hypothetical protein